MNSVGGRLDLRKLFYFKVFFHEKERQMEKEVKTHSEMKTFPFWQRQCILKCSCQKMFLAQYDKDTHFVQEMQVQGIFAGIIPLTPVYSRVAHAENLPPLSCLIFFLYIIFFYIPLPSHPAKFANSAFELQLSACLGYVRDLQSSLLIEQIRWRALGCSREGVSFCKELDHGGN